MDINRGCSYLLTSLVSLQNSSKGLGKRTAEGEDFLDMDSRQKKKDPAVTLKTAYPKALNFPLAPAA